MTPEAPPYRYAMRRLRCTKGFGGGVSRMLLCECPTSPQVVAGTTKPGSALMNQSLSGCFPDPRCHATSLNPSTPHFFLLAMTTLCVPLHRGPLWVSRRLREGPSLLIDALPHYTLSSLPVPQNLAVDQRCTTIRAGDTTAG